MKNIVFLLVLSMSVLNQTSMAQADFLREPDTKRPLLFADKPSVAPVSATELQKIFALSTGADVTIASGAAELFSGKISSVGKQANNTVQTTTIRLVNREKANLVISAITDEAGNVVYTAKVISFQHSDCFVLEKTNEESYQFIKKSFYEVVGE